MNISGSTSDILMELQEPEGHHLLSQAFSSHSQFPASGRMPQLILKLQGRTTTFLINNYLYAGKLIYQWTYDK